MNNNWNLNRLEKQATNNQSFDEFVLQESKILDNKDLKVLDIGCSNGFKTKMLFDKYDNIIKIDGIDIDENAIKEAKESFKDNFKYSFELRSIDELDTNNKYDIINLSYVLQHLKNPEEILKKLKELLTDRGIIIIKVPDDSFKSCYPNNELLKDIFKLYDEDLIKKSSITKYTDRYIGKKVYNFLINNEYKDIKLYYSITDTIEKSIDERLNIFESSIAFRKRVDSEYMDDISLKQMELLLDEMKENFKKEDFYYTMTVLYYIAGK